MLGRGILILHLRFASFGLYLGFCPQTDNVSLSFTSIPLYKFILLLQHLVRRDINVQVPKSVDIFSKIIIGFRLYEKH